MNHSHFGHYLLLPQAPLTNRPLAMASNHLCFYHSIPTTTGLSAIMLCGYPWSPEDEPDLVTPTFLFSTSSMSILVSCLQYLHNYCIDCHDIVCRYPCSPEDEPQSLWSLSAFASSSIDQSTISNGPIDHLGFYQLFILAFSTIFPLVMDWEPSCCVQISMVLWGWTRYGNSNFFI